jgi:thioredoxin 1
MQIWQGLRQYGGHNCLPSITKGNLMSREITLTDATFDQTISSSTLPILVDFWAPWCGPCRFIAPVLAEISEEKAELITIGKMNVDDNPVVPSRFGITGIPTMILFKNGKAVEKIVGALPKAMIEKALEPHLK